MEIDKNNIQENEQYYKNIGSNVKNFFGVKDKIKYIDEIKLQFDSKLEELKSTHLGKGGIIDELSSNMRALKAPERVEYGKKINELVKHIKDSFNKL